MSGATRFDALVNQAMIAGKVAEQATGNVSDLQRRLILALKEEKDAVQSLADVKKELQMLLNEQDNRTKVPANPVPANKAPVNPANKAPVNKAPANNVPANKAPANNVPANPAPANPEKKEALCSWNRKCPDGKCEDIHYCECDEPNACEHPTWVKNVRDLTQQQLQVVACAYFHYGGCNNGDKCKYYHITDIEQLARLGQLRHPNKGKTQCFHHLKKEGCRLSAEDCNFSHD
jgi:hypothetical protein